MLTSFAKIFYSMRDNKNTDHVEWFQRTINHFNKLANRPRVHYKKNYNNAAFVTHVGQQQYVGQVPYVGQPAYVGQHVGQQQYVGQVPYVGHPAYVVQWYNNLF